VGKQALELVIKPRRLCCIRDPDNNHADMQGRNFWTPRPDRRALMAGDLELPGEVLKLLEKRLGCSFA
jgi:hypothetical protein